MPFDTIFSWIIKKRIDQIEHFTFNPIVTQKDVWDSLLDKAKETEFGKQYDFKNTSGYRDFKNNIPLQTQSYLN